VKSLWSDHEADRFRAQYAGSHGEDVALRIYTSRLIGGDPALVLHGGGNTSVKTVVTDLLGNEIEVLRVKGSGSDLAGIEPEGLVEVELDRLRRLRPVEAMADEEMINQIRLGVRDSKAPNPSLETFLHAFLPAKFVDHSHADAILVLSNQPDGPALIGEALGEGVVILPWVHPGYPLAKQVAAAVEENPDCEAVVLLHHGIFTFADEARESYERMIDLVDRAERWIESRIAGAPPMLTVAPDLDTSDRLPVADIAAVVRGALAESMGSGRWRRLIAEVRNPPDLVAFAGHADAAALLELGPLTPDHLIRTQLEYLRLSHAQAADPDACREAIRSYIERYIRYFEEHKGSMPEEPVMADPRPRVVVVEGIGVIAFGENKRAAIIAADIAEQTLRGKALAAAIGTYAELDRRELFRQEYWPLERAKLGQSRAPAMEGQVALITGAAGAIGGGIAEAALEAGAQVVLTDLDADRLASCEARLAERHGTASICARVADVTNPEQIAAVFATACESFGGVDCVVPNAGVAHVSSLKDMDPERFRLVLEVNLNGTMNVLKEAARLFELQQSGGSVVVQASKNVFDPGARFGAYSASKAGAHQLGKIAALEFAPLGVTVNMINADAVFGEDEAPSGLWAEVGPDRMRARGLDPQGLRDYYRDRSLLKFEVSPEDVGRAVVFFASGQTPTTGATLPVDGGIPGAFPR